MMRSGYSCLKSQVFRCW